MPRLALPAFSVIKDQRCQDYKNFDEKYPALEIETTPLKSRQRLFSYPMCNSLLYRTKCSPLPKVQEESASVTDDSSKDVVYFCEDGPAGDQSNLGCPYCERKNLEADCPFRQRSISLPSKREHLEQLRHLNHVVSHSAGRFSSLKVDRDVKQQRRLCRSASLGRERKLSDLPNIEELGDFSDDQVLDKIVADEVTKLQNYGLGPRKSCGSHGSTDTSDASDSEVDSSGSYDRSGRPTVRARRYGFSQGRAFSAPPFRP